MRAEHARGQRIMIACEKRTDADLTIELEALDEGGTLHELDEVGAHDVF